VFTRSLFLLAGLMSLAGMFARLSVPGARRIRSSHARRDSRQRRGQHHRPASQSNREEVQKLHPHLKSFTLKHMESKSLKYAEKVSLPAVEDKKVDMVIKPRRRTRRTASAWPSPRRAWAKSSIARCAASSCRLSRAIHTKGKELLILAIRVSPFRGD